MVDATAVAALRAARDPQADLEALRAERDALAAELSRARAERDALAARAALVRRALARRRPAIGARTAGWALLALSRLR